MKQNHSGSEIASRLISLAYLNVIASCDEELPAAAENVAYSTSWDAVQPWRRVVIRKVTHVDGPSVQ